MRWQLPFHLLDGALYPSSRMSTATWHESPEAQLLLSQLCEAVNEGFARCALQSVPHVTLLERSFYEERLRPLLTHWALLWLRRNRVQQGTDEHIIAYLSRDTPKSAAPAGASDPTPVVSLSDDDPLRAQAREAANASAAAAAKEESDALSRVEAQRWQWLVSRLSPEHMQLLNLARTWLHSVLPHILCKVARVHFGLLPERYLAEAAAAAAAAANASNAAAPSADAPAERAPPLRTASSASLGGGGGGGGGSGDGTRMAAIPQSRRLLAVPFVGKDVPSHAAEFSHPDALIGLTILAYRHQGLRRADFVGLINLLLEQMEQESGPYRHRPTCRLYARWVRLTGGAVRGMVSAADDDALPSRPSYERHSSQASLGLDSQRDSGRRDSREGSSAVEGGRWHTRAHGGGGGGTKGVGGGSDDDGTPPQDLWPLQLLNPSDDEQIGVLFGLLGTLPHVIQHYLDNLAFPLTMQHQAHKLSANGQVRCARWRL